MNIHQIDETQWVWDVDGHAVSGLLSDGIIVRKVTGININDLPELVEVLRLRSSVKNPDDKKRYRTIDKPMVGGKEQDGTWYSVNVKSIDGIHNPGRGLNPAGTIIQTLALWQGSLDQVWTRDTINPSFAAESITETFTHIPLAAMDAYKATLAVADSGYKVASIRDKIYEDGYGDLVQTQEKLFGETISATNGIDTNAEYLPLLTGGVFRTTAWIGVSDDDLETAMTTLATPPSGYFVRTLANNYNGTGSCTIVRTMGPEGPFDATAQAVQFPGFDDERRTYWHAGLNATQATAKYTELKTTCDAGYKVDLVEVREYRWETVLVIQNISKLNLTLTGTVNQTDYTKTFGLVNIATTFYPNIAHDSIAALKETILDDTTKLVLRLYDDDTGQGKANVTCVWRSKESAPTALGAIRSTKPSAFHPTTQERVWINVNLEDADSLKDAVAAALAGTGTYAKNTNDTVVAATGDDAGDKTGIIRQQVLQDISSYVPADYATWDQVNPHGLRQGGMLAYVREYPEVPYNTAALALIASTLYVWMIDGTPPAGGVATGYPPGEKHGKVQVSLNANGTLNIRAFKECKPDWNNTTPTYNKTNVRNPGAIGQQETFQATGVPVASAPAIVAGAAASSADYQLDSSQFIERGNGEAVIESTQTLKDETAVIVRNIPARGSQREMTERIWPLVKHTNFATICATALTTGVSVTDSGYPNNILDYIQADLLPNGMWRISTMVVKCPKTTLIDAVPIACNDDNDVTLTQVQDATSVPDIYNASPTSVRLASLEKNRYGRYDYTKITTTHKSPVSAGSSYGWTTVGETYWLPHVYNTDGTLFQLLQYQRTYTHTITFHTTATSAASAITGGYEGSNVNQISPYIWQAHKIVQSATQVGYLNTSLSSY